MSEAAAHMDAIYRFQRHIYDITRKPYLLGRDVLIAELSPPPAGRVLEIGCGTARNLLKIAQRYPQVRCFGIDVSSAMLVTAQASIRRAGLEGRVVVAQADACHFDPRQTLGVEAFERVVISYALSMIPAWPSVVQSATQWLAPGGELHVADFGDQQHLPRWFRAGLNIWLRQFSVTPRADLARQLQVAARQIGGAVETRQLYGGYAVVSHIRMPSLPASRIR
jgi:S-adenosylmethionine-diacylgycerolhomoserine-N-methlytransferase